MKEDFVRDQYGRKIGIKRTENNGDITILTFPGRIPLGVYVVAYDHTIELPSRLIVSRGDTVVALLYKGK